MGLTVGDCELTEAIGGDAGLIHYQRQTKLIKIHQTCLFWCLFLWFVIFARDMSIQNELCDSTKSFSNENLIMKVILCKNPMLPLLKYKAETFDSQWPVNVLLLYYISESLETSVQP